MKINKENFKACLLGGTIGDALGKYVENMTLNEIQGKYGINGIAEMEFEEDNVSDITYITQMMLFTAEGILRSKVKQNKTGVNEDLNEINSAYLRWLASQGIQLKEDINNEKSWLLDVKSLHRRNNTDKPSIYALIKNENPTKDKPVNDEVTCASVVRMAPVGLIYSKDEAFEKAMEFAILTHGNPRAYLSAGTFAHIISLLIEGKDIVDATKESINKLKEFEGNDILLKKFEEVLELFEKGEDDLEVIRIMNNGRDADDALAVAMFLSLKYKENFTQAIHAAVNHDGKSSEIASLTGSILGAHLGKINMTNEMIDGIEVKDTIEEMAHDLSVGYANTKKWQEKYSG